MKAVRLEVLYASESATRGSMVGEKIAMGAPPAKRWIVCRRIEIGSIWLAIARPVNPPERVEDTMLVMRLWRRSLR